MCWVVFICPWELLLLLGDLWPGEGRGKGPAFCCRLIPDPFTTSAGGQVGFLPPPAESWMAQKGHV